MNEQNAADRFDHKILHRINDYLAGEITSDELRIWAMNEYMELMRGKYIYIDHLLYYRFIKCLSSFSDSPETYVNSHSDRPSSVNDILKIKNVLDSKENITLKLSLFIRNYLPFSQDSDEYLSISNLDAALCKNDETAINIAEEGFHKIISNYSDTIIGVVCHQIIGALRQYPDNDFLFSNLCVGGRATPSISDVNERLYHLTGFLLGRESINCLISFLDGKPYLSMF